MCILLSWGRSCAHCRSGQQKTVDKQSRLDRAAVQQASLEVRQAYQVLAQVEDPDMVDYAVFTLQAAEKRYAYLIKKMKEQESYDEVNKSVPMHCVEG